MTFQRPHLAMAAGLTAFALLADLVVVAHGRAHRTPRPQSVQSVQSTAPGHTQSTAPGHTKPKPQCFCPSAKDLQWDYEAGEGSEIRDGGWTITSGGRVSTKGLFNLLGGYIEYDMDISKTFIGVNTNVYGIFPFLAEGDFAPDAKAYCDGQPTTQLFCPEMDFVENNGPVGFGSTWHTIPGFVANGTNDELGCDAHGCAADRFYKPPAHYAANCISREPAPVIDSSQSFTMRISFDEWTGNMVTTLKQHGAEMTIAGDNFTNDFGFAPDSNDRAVVRQMMQDRGMVVESSLWVGWVPVDDACPSWNPTPDGATFSVSNLKLQGKLVRGSAMSCPCSEESPTPLPMPTPGASVDCTYDNKTKCAGNQCCPRSTNTSGKTYPCPSADPGWDGCETGVHGSSFLGARKTAAHTDDEETSMLQQPSSPEATPLKPEDKEDL